MRNTKRFYLFVETTAGDTVPSEALVDVDRVVGFYQVADTEAGGALIMRGEERALVVMEDFQEVIDRIFTDKAADLWHLTGIVSQKDRKVRPLMVWKNEISWVAVNPLDKEGSILSLSGFEIECSDSFTTMKTAIWP